MLLRKEIARWKDIAIMPHILPGVQVRVNIDQTFPVACSFHPVVSSDMQLVSLFVAPSSWLCLGQYQRDLSGAVTKSLSSVSCELPEPLLQNMVVF